MNRKKFLAATLASVPAFAFGNVATFDSLKKEPFIIRSGKNRASKPMMKFMGLHDNDVIISRKDTAEEISVFLFSGFKNASTPLHVHFKQDEFFHIIQGDYRFVCGEMQEELREGDTIFLPRNIPHQWLQLSDTGRLLYAVNPAGSLEDMFLELDQLKSTPAQEKLQNIHQKHGMKIMGPPLSL